MSGGHFSYYAGIISSLAGEVEEELDSDWFLEANFSVETVESIEESIKHLRESYIRLQRIDWLFSGDDGEETYHKRLLKDLENLNKEV